MEQPTRGPACLLPPLANVGLIVNRGREIEFGRRSPPTHTGLLGTMAGCLDGDRAPNLRSDFFCVRHRQPLEKARRSSSRPASVRGSGSSLWAAMNALRRPAAEGAACRLPLALSQSRTAAASSFASSTAGSRTSAKPCRLTKASSNACRQQARLVPAVLRLHPLAINEWNPVAAVERMVLPCLNCFAQAGRTRLKRFLVGERALLVAAP